MMEPRRQQHWRQPAWGTEVASYPHLLQRSREGNHSLSLSHTLTHSLSHSLSHSLLSLYLPLISFPFFFSLSLSLSPHPISLPLPTAAAPFSPLLSSSASLPLPWPFSHYLTFKLLPSFSSNQRHFSIEKSGIG